jgi:hypothetical protein
MCSEANLPPNSVEAPRVAAAMGVGAAPGGEVGSQALAPAQEAGPMHRGAHPVGLLAIRLSPRRHRRPTFPQLLVSRPVRRPAAGTG